MNNLFRRKSTKHMTCALHAITRGFTKSIKSEIVKQVLCQTEMLQKAASHQEVWKFGSLLLNTRPMGPSVTKHIRHITNKVTAD